VSSPEKFGKAFVGFSWVLLLIGLGVFFQQYINTKENPNQSPDSLHADVFIEVVLQRNYQNHYVATGLINDTPVRFLVDTGATNVSLGPSLAKRIGLTRGAEGIATTANGTTKVIETRLERLSLGDIQFENVRASITMGMTGEDVLLGMSALKDVELVHKDGQLTIRQYRPLGEAPSN
jgi:aspartyl protease family protein